MLAPTRTPREAAVATGRPRLRHRGCRPGPGAEAAFGRSPSSAPRLLLLTALGLTGVGLVMNARFAASFGQTLEAAALLAAIGLAIDLLAVVLPSVGVQFWHRRSILASAAAWSIWLAVLVMTWLAATGFASTNIGDAVAGRARIASESAVLTERLNRLRHERAGITELRPVAAIEVELQRAQPQAQAVWHITDGCRDVTRPASARACATVLELRQAQAAAVRRDAIDVEQREIQSRLAALPAIAAADPQATSAAEIVRLAQRRHVHSRRRTTSPGCARSASRSRRRSPGLIAMMALALVRRA